jgi:cyclophilin family peptidyl-prolyl cis-trans isomerase
MSRVTNPFGLKKTSSINQQSNNTQNSSQENSNNNNNNNLTNNSQTFNKPPKKSEIKPQTTQETPIQSPYNNNNNLIKKPSANSINSTENNFIPPSNNNINSISHYDLNSMSDEETNDIITYFNNTLKHTRGVISMARSRMPDSAGSQFFIMHKDAPHLDGEYAAFGKMISGFETLDEIANTRCDYSDRPFEEQKIESITVIE